MKKLNILPAGLVAGAALVVLASGAKAQTVTSNQGDLFLGFNDPANTTYDYVVDLGPASYFLSLAQSPGTTDITTAAYGGAGLGNIANDLSTAFGTSWYANGTTGSNVQWGIAGTSGVNPGDSTVFGLPNATLFLTIGESTPGSGSTAPLETTSANQNQTANKIENDFEAAFDGLNDTSNSTVATLESNGGSDSWGSYVTPQTHAFGLNYDIEQPLSGSFTGPTDSQLDLYELEPSTTNAKGTELGSFTLDSSGNLDFTSAAVPEPSTYATVGLGAALLLLFRRQSRKVVAG